MFHCLKSKSHLRLIEGWFVLLDEVAFIGQNKVMTSVGTFYFKKRRHCEFSVSTLCYVSMDALGVILWITHSAAVVAASITDCSLRLANVV